jgi:hypothetical protein
MTKFEKVIYNDRWILNFFRKDDTWEVDNAFMLPPKNFIVFEEEEEEEKRRPGDISYEAESISRLREYLG